MLHPILFNEPFTFVASQSQAATENLQHALRWSDYTDINRAHIKSVGLYSKISNKQFSITL